MATETMIERQERATRNQSLFRDMNEQLEERVTGSLSFRSFTCECSSEACNEFVSLTHHEYEEIRRHPARFAVKPGHVLLGEEIVVLPSPHHRYVVVEKLERGAEVATHFDPRQRKAIDRLVAALAPERAR